MSNLRTAAQQALEALEFMADEWGFTQKANRPERWQAIEALRAALEQPERAQAMRDAGYTRRPTLREMAALEQPEQEPVAWRYQNSLTDTEYLVWNKGTGGRNWTPLYTHPPRREQPKFTLSCGCPSQYGGVPAYWDRDGSTAFGMICEKHWHEYGARSEA
jgi:hypothetical protein